MAITRMPPSLEMGKRRKSRLQSLGIRMLAEIPLMDSYHLKQGSLLVKLVKTAIDAVGWLSATTNSHKYNVKLVVLRYVIFNSEFEAQVL